MSLKLDEIKKIAHLARLRLSDDEISIYGNQLSSILTFIAHMDEVDTTAIEPLAHPLDIYQRLRNDDVTEPNLRDQYQQIAPQVEAGLYLVPKVIDEA